MVCVFVGPQNPHVSEWALNPHVCEWVSPHLWPSRLELDLISEGPTRDRREKREERREKREKKLEKESARAREREIERERASERERERKSRGATAVRRHAYSMYTGTGKTQVACAGTRPLLHLFIYYLCLY